MTTQIAHRPRALLAPQLDYILLDGSQSMRSKWWKSCDAIDSYLALLRHAQLNAQVVLATFDSHDVSCVQRDCELRDWATLRAAPIGAHWGQTPLYDAINAMGRALHDLQPERAHLIVVTDGEENHSVTTQEQACGILNWCRAKGWQVTFLGAEFNNTAQAALLGADRGSAIGVTAARLTDATTTLARKRIRYGHTGEAIHFTEEERQEFGGYLAARGDVA